MGYGDTPLARWLQNLTGSDKRYKNPRQLALAAGLNDSTLTRNIERGSADPETIVKVCRALGLDPLPALALSGLLTEEEAAKGLDKEEARYLRAFHQLPEGRRELLFQLATELLAR